jgi:hypothetical protein
MPRVKKDKALEEVKGYSQKLKTLYGLLIDTYIKALEDSPEGLNATYLKEINEFLSRNGITLSNMLNLDQLNNLKYLSSELKGDMLRDTENHEACTDSLLESLEPYDESEWDKDRENFQ